jgi:hypothetical protein
MSTTCKQVRVYFNLHRKKLSIQEKVNGQWKVTRHADEIMLADVKFKVYEKGRQRVLSEKRKNVHAFIIGNLVEQVPDDEMTTVRYNPYQLERFHDGTGYIDNAAFVKIVDRTISAINK